jgi:hypothetical protein
MMECEAEVGSIPCGWIFLQEHDCHELESLLVFDIKSGRHLDVGSEVW